MLGSFGGGNRKTKQSEEGETERPRQPMKQGALIGQHTIRAQPGTRDRVGGCWHGDRVGTRVRV